MAGNTALEEFKELSKVPRRSFHNEKIIAYCIDWAKNHGFEWFYDDKNENVIIRKPASPGKEDRPGIVMQGHLDMVAATAPGVVHDWENEPLTLIEDGDWIHADGTTLGADDGVAPALAFAIFTDETISHPPLEILLTTNEEVGMDSVKNADLTMLKGKYLYNLDSSGDGVFTVGCCGGHTLKVNVPNKREAYQGNAFTFEISGLKGGHSGERIHIERANALNLLGKFLYGFKKEHDIRISSVIAEGKDNMISNNATCTFITDADPASVKEYVDSQQEEVSKLYRLSDKRIKFSLKEAEADDALDKTNSDALIFLLHELPFGLLHVEQNLKGTETSVNIGPCKTTDEAITLRTSIRSSVAERLVDTRDKIQGLCDICGATLTDTGKAYPAWLPDFESPLIKLFGDLYTEMFGTEPEFKTIHGGLECGFIMKNSNIEDAIALGPVMYGIHTPKEKLSISSMNKTYELLKAAIEAV